MAGIGGYLFSYDGIRSDKYGLRFGYMSNSFSESKIEANYDYSFKAFGRRKYMMTKRELKDDEPLTFNAEIFREEPFTFEEEREINRWLFNKNGFRKLEIVNNDLDSNYQEIYWNCILTQQKPFRVGCGDCGFSFTVTCDAPSAWKHARQMVYNFQDDNYAQLMDSFSYYNESDDNNGYTCPTLKITIGKVGGRILFENTSDVNKDGSNRLSVFDNLQPQEIITIDEYGQIQSSIGQLRAQDFNKNTIGDYMGRIKFLAGYNNYNVSGDIKQLIVDCEIPVRVAI